MTKFNSPNKSSKSQSFRNFQRSMQGKCMRCGSSKHRRTGCDKKNVKCYACGKGGHMANVCFARLTGRLKDQPKSQEKKAPARIAKVAKPRSRSAPATPVPLDEGESTDEEEVTSCKVVKHKLFLIQNKHGEKHKTSAFSNPCLLYTSPSPRDRG